MIRETAQLWLTDNSSTQHFEAALEKRMHVSGIHQHHLGRNLEGSLGGGDFTLDVLWQDASDPDLLNELEGLQQVDRVSYTPLASGSRQPEMSSGVFRTLLFQVHTDAAEHRIQRLERDLLAMPDYMPGILNWSLGRVTSQSRWTHVWQQEYQHVEDLLGEYLMHPYHWGYVDRFFDPDSPDWLVDPHLAHCYCPLQTSVL